MDAGEWLDALWRRPDFEERALLLRQDAAALDQFLVEFFHLDVVREDLRTHVVAGLRDTVMRHAPADGGALYQECVWSLQLQFREGVFQGKGSPELQSFPRLSADLEARALAARSTSELRPYLAEAFREILSVFPKADSERILDGLEDAVAHYDRPDPRGLLAQCIAAVAERLPAEVEVEAAPQHRVVAREAKPLIVKQ